MREKIRPCCQAFLRGFLGLFLTAQCVLGVCYWLGNVTRAQQFDTVSAMGRWVSSLPVLPVHVVQTAAVYGGLFYFFGCFFHGRRRAFLALAVLTIPFVMQVCLSETEHGAALTAVLCMAGMMMDCHIHGRRQGRVQAVMCAVCVGVLLLCGAAYSCGAALLYLVLSVVQISASGKRKRDRVFYSLAALLISVCFALTGMTIQNKLNPDRMQITWESVLLKRFAYPGLNENLMEGLPPEMQEIYTRSEINSFRLYPYLLDTTLEGDLLAAVGKERTEEIYLELAWYGFMCGTKVDARMILEDVACYLSPLLMYPFYSDGTILAEYGWSYQQFLTGTPYLAELYMYVSLVGYAVGLLLTLIFRVLHCLLLKSARPGALNSMFVKRLRPLIVLWAGLSVLFMMRGAAVFNYKYAAFQAVLGYLVLFAAIKEREQGWVI
ncbi:MAG: hypothetical protein LUH19_01075 [Lachnospiraceae bacterium]|nr:hypothetical protein [Lachnospiraceae bacterium]